MGRVARVAASAGSPAARALLLLCLTALAMSPTAAAETVLDLPDTPTPTRLYFHFIGMDDSPINTQPPHEGYVVTPTHGLGQFSSTCLPSPDGVGFVGEQVHSYYGYSSPSYVEYETLENGRPRVHPERGLSYDVLLAPGAPWTLDWYIESQATSTGGGADPNQAPVLVPDVVVKATVRGGDDFTADGKGYDTGPLIAEGQSEAITLAGPASDQANSGKATYLGTNQTASGHWVTGFRVPLAPTATVIPKATGYNVRVDVQVRNPACEGLMPNLVRLHSSPAFRPSMDLSILNPVVLEALHPQFVGDELVVHVEANSPWGNYDVDEREGGFGLTLRGPAPYDAQDPPGLTRTKVVHHTNPHNQHTQPIMVTYVWPYLEDAAPVGDYKVAFNIWNDQHTAQAVGTSTFTIGKGDLPEAKGADAVGAGVLAAIAGCALLVRRRT